MFYLIFLINMNPWLIFMEAVKHDLVVFLSSFVCQFHSLEANRIFEPILPEIGWVRMLVNGILWCWIHLSSCERKIKMVDLSLATVNNNNFDWYHSYTNSGLSTHVPAIHSPLMYFHLLLSICLNSRYIEYSPVGWSPETFTLIRGNILLPFLVTIISFT